MSEVEALVDRLVAQFEGPYDFLRELVQNSLDAGSDRAEVALEVHEGDDPDAVVYELRVADAGSGMDEAVIDGVACRTYLTERDRAHAAVLLRSLRAEIPRFQALLCGGVPFREPLAKSLGMASRTSQAAAAQSAGWPVGLRHELVSLVSILRDATHDLELDFDVLLHLIASHHGRTRPLISVVDDEAVSGLRATDLADRLIDTIMDGWTHESSS